MMSSEVSQHKLPINSMRVIDPANVVAWGVDSIITNLPKRNYAEENFDKSKELYLQCRESFCPKFEGRWLLVSAETQAVHMFTTEEHASAFRDALDLRTAYLDCLGREVLECVDIDDEETIDNVSNEVNKSGIAQMYPSYTSNMGNHVWGSALWLPASWSTFSISPVTSFMKLDTGASSVGAPSKELFKPGIKFGKEKNHRGVGGISLLRTALKVTIEHAGHQVIIPEVFEYNKWLLGYSWFKHYNININVHSNPPFTCTPIK